MTGRSTGRLTGAPATVIFSNGEEIQFHPLSDRDIGELDEYLQARQIEIARKSLGPECTPEERKETLKLAMEEARSLTVLSPMGARALATIDGMVHLTFISARRSHPNLSKDHLKELLLNPENLERVNEAFSKVNDRHPKASSLGNARRVKRRPRHRGK